MTPYRFCKMIAYHCDDRGQPTTQKPWTVNVEKLHEFFHSRLGFYTFEDTGLIITPEEWPLIDYPLCAQCRHSVIGDYGHLVLQWGDKRDDYNDPEWAEWQAALHSPRCIAKFFKMLTGGGEAYDTMEEWRGWIDPDIPF